MAPRRQAKPDVPRWRRGRPTTTPLSPKERKALIAEAAAVGAALNGTVRPPAGSKVMARTGAFRFRYQLIPVAWILVVLATGMGAHAGHNIRAGLLLGLGGCAGMVLATRHMSEFARTWAAVMAILTALWLPVLALDGLTPPIPPFLFACWLAVLVPWAAHYRIRREVMTVPDQTDIELWATTLGAKGRLAGSRLSPLEDIRNGTKYTLHLKRGEQDSADVFGMSKKIASLFGKPVTEVYAERFPDAREHEVMVTRLRRNTLTQIRMWDGAGIDPATGLAVIGDYPDGEPAHFRFWSPRNGAEQSIVVGVKGGGKSYALHLLLACAVTSQVPVVPIVLDPQQGQSLLDWRGQVTYARNPDQCMVYLRAFEAGMTARSAHLADFPWTDEDGYERPGMDFYDPHLSGLPLIFLVFDEAHLLLGDPRYGEEAKRITGNLVKLNRKAGGSLVLASHTLLLSQLGDMTLRAMVVGGNAVALRTGENLSGGIIGLEADPKLLPRTFPDGTETHGLGYIVGPDNRPDSPMRSRLVPNPRKVAVDAQIAEMDPVFGDAFRAVLDQAKGTAPAVRSASLAAVPLPEDDKPGRAAADAILSVLTEELDRGQIIVACRDLAGKWGRGRPFSTKTISDALRKLVTEGKITQAGDRAPYAPVRASLHAVGRSPGNGKEAS